MKQFSLDPIDFIKNSPLLPVFSCDLIQWEWEWKGFNSGDFVVMRPVCCLSGMWWFYFFLLEEAFFWIKKPAGVLLVSLHLNPSVVFEEKQKKYWRGNNNNKKTPNQPKTKPTLWTDLPIPTIYRSKQNNILIFKTSFLFMPCHCCHLLMFHGLYTSGRRLCRVTYWFVVFPLLNWKCNFLCNCTNITSKICFTFFLRRKYFCLSFFLSLSFLVSVP